LSRDSHGHDNRLKVIWRPRRTMPAGAWPGLPEQRNAITQAGKRRSARRIVPRNPYCAESAVPAASRNRKFATSYQGADFRSRYRKVCANGQDRLPPISPRSERKCQCNLERKLYAVLQNAGVARTQRSFLLRATRAPGTAGFPRSGAGGLAAGRLSDRPASSLAACKETHAPSAMVLAWLLRSATNANSDEEQADAQPACNTTYIGKH